MKKNIKGITLISLIITIIILLILAGIALNFAIGENGIFKLANNASKNYINTTKKEESEIAKVEEYIQNSRETVTIPKEEYEALKSAVQNLTTIQHYDASSYEINSSYFDVSKSSVQVSRIGNIVNISFYLLPTTSISNSNQVFIKNLPKPTNNLGILFVGRTAQTQKIDMKIGIDGSLSHNWGTTIPTDIAIHGSTTYICE